MNNSIIILNEGSYELAKKIRKQIGGIIYGKRQRVTSNVDIYFDNAIDCLVQQYNLNNNIIAIMSTGIVIRAIAPYIKPKRQDSAVIVLDENADNIVPLLGGHNGGYSISKKLGDALNSNIVLTTSGDINFGFALDDLGENYEISNYDIVKNITAQLIENGDVELINKINGFEFEHSHYFKGNKNSKYKVIISCYSNEHENENTLVIYPKCLSVGIGLERYAPFEPLYQFINDTFEKFNLSKRCINKYASIDLKIDEPALKQLRISTNKKILFFDKNELNSVNSLIKNPSEIVNLEIGTYSVSEASSILLGGNLLIEKQKFTKYTMAISLKTKV